ncbi:MAG: hypothetical protein QXI33_03125, partial [Candidatus Pacearchaeota archaeon]
MRKKIILAIFSLMVLSFLLFLSLGSFSSASVQPSNFNGLPSGFTPKVGYYHGFLGGRISLWDAEGNIYQSADGINFNKITRESLSKQGLPLEFKPTLGYYHNLTNSDGQVVLWNVFGASYQTKSGKGSKWLPASYNDTRGLPIGFKPVASRYSPLSKSEEGNLNLWDLSGNQYRRTDVLASWVRVNASNVFPQNIPPLFSYYFNNKGVIILDTLQGSNYRWYNVKGNLVVYKSNPPSGDGVPPEKINVTGLPSGIPTLGYADYIRNKVVVWYGNDAYESSNGVDFVKVNIGNVLCSSNLQCDDFNERTYDECINPGTQNSYCRHTEISCLADVECGYTGYIGEEYCSQNTNLYRDYQSSVCVDAGSINSYCSVNISSRLVEECIYGCSNNSCNSPIQCIDIDGGINYYLRGNTSKGNVTYNDYCTNSSNILEFYCSNNTIQNIQYSCANGCFQGTCLPSPTQCTQDNQCGSVVSQLTCEGNDVHNVTQYPVCNNGVCGSRTFDFFVQYCPFGCSQGTCLPSPTQCTQDNQCGSVVSQLTCEGNDVHNVTQYPVCNN